MCLVCHACRLSWVGAPAEALSSIPHIVVIIIVRMTFILWKPHLRCWVWASSSVPHDIVIIVIYRPFVLQRPCPHCPSPMSSSSPSSVAIRAVEALSLSLSGGGHVNHPPHYHHHHYHCHCHCYRQAFCPAEALSSVPHHCRCHCRKMVVVVASLQGKRARPYPYCHRGEREGWQGQECVVIRERASANTCCCCLSVLSLRRG